MKYSKTILFGLVCLFIRISAFVDTSFSSEDSLMVSDCKELFEALTQTWISTIGVVDCINCPPDSQESLLAINRNLTIIGVSNCPIRWTTPGAAIRVQETGTLRFQNLTILGATGFKDDDAPRFLEVVGNGSVEFHNVVLGEHGAARRTIRQYFAAPCLRKHTILFCNSTVVCGRGTESGGRRLKLAAQTAFQQNASENDESAVQHTSRSRRIQRIAIPVAGLVFFGIFVFLFFIMIRSIASWRRNKRLVQSRESQNTSCHSTEQARLGHESQREDLSFDNIDMERATFERQLGRGEHGCVYRANYEGRTVAIKVILARDVDSDGRQEAYLAQGALHPNVVRSYCTLRRGSTYRRDSVDLDDDDGQSSSSSGSLDDFINSASTAALQRNSWLIMMEFCDLGSLKNVLGASDIRDRLQGPTASHAAFLHKIASDISKGMLYLHRKNIVHGDLKPQNVLLQSCPSDPFGFVAKVGDLGLSRNMTHSALVRTRTCGSVRYMSPELLREGLLSMKTDVYSFGMVLWEMVMESEPFVGKSDVEVMLMVSEGRRPHSLASIPGELGVIMRLCLQQDYTDRPGFDHIVATLEGRSSKPHSRSSHYLATNPSHTYYEIPTTNAT